ncbi:hypothetical protein ScPMuIL_002655 [Solemya velum]
MISNLLNGNSSGIADFCGGSPIWDPTSLETDSPRFPDCFQQTLLVWISCGWLWISLPFYITYLLRKSNNLRLLPCSALNISKTVLCVFLVCLVLIGQLTEEHSGFQCAGLKIPTSHFVATGIKAGTFLLVAVLVQIQRLKGDITSGVLFLFWLLQLLAAIVPLQSKISNQPGCPESCLLCLFWCAFFWGFY